MKRKFSEQQQQRGNARDLLVRGVAAAKAGDKREARFYLEWALIAGVDEEQQMEVWLWLAEVSEGQEKRRYLEEVLSRRPADARARRMLAIAEGRLREDELIDPNALAARVPAQPHAGMATARQFRCPNCAARMVFTPDGAGLHCEHCGHRQQPEEQGPVQETDFIVTMATTRGHLQPAATPTFACRSCSASFLLPAGTLAVTCPYCHHTYSVETAEMRELAPPQGLIPFAVDEAQATQRLRQWLAEHGLRPHAPPQGLYLPIWTFDVGGGIDWQGQVWQNQGQMGREMSTWETVSGSHALFEDDLLVAACNTLPAALQPLLTTYDLQQVVAFDEAYLAAWPAQTYQIAAGDASLAARKTAFERGRKAVQQRHGHVKSLRCSSAGVAILSHKLLLLPVWLAHYRSGQETLALAINGQTGRLQPEQEPQTGLLDSLGRWLDKLGGS